MRAKNIIISVLGSAFFNNCLAVDITPGDLFPLSAGTNFFQLSLQQVEREGFYRNGDLKLKSPKLVTEQTILKYGHFSEVATMPTYAHVEIPYISFDSSGNPMMRSNRVSGIGDLNLAFGIWPYANKEKHRYWAVGGYFILPTGSYDENNLYNPGSNRYTVDLQTAYQMAITPSLLWLVAVDGMWFSNNYEFGALRSTQHLSPFYTKQTGFRYILNKQISFSGLWIESAGAESTINGIKQNDCFDFQRYQIGIHSKLNNNNVSLLYGAELHTENGLFEMQRWTLRIAHIF